MRCYHIVEKSACQKVKDCEKMGQRSGSILGIVLVLTFLMSALGLGVLTLGQRNAVLASRYLNRHKAFWMAESGLQDLNAIIYNKPYHGPLEKLALVSTNNHATLKDAVVGMGSYEVFVTRLVGRNYRATSIGTAPDGTRHAVSCAIRLTSFAEHVYTTNTEENHEFTPSDRIEGPIRTNGQLSFNGITNVPHRVISAARGYNYSPGMGLFDEYLVHNNGIFSDGLELGAYELNYYPRLTKDIQDNSIKVISNGGYFDVTLQGDKMHIVKMYNNRVQWTNTVAIADPYTDLKDPNNPKSYNKTVMKGDYDKDEHNTIFFGDPVFIRGTVKGDITIISQYSVTIDGDILYASAGSKHNFEEWGDNFKPTDSLGIFAHKAINIDIPDGIRNDRDVNIHAALMTELKDLDGTGLRSDDWNVDLGDAKINLYGSVSQYRAGILNDPETGTGYGINFHYDARFRENPPQGTPYGPPEITGWNSSSL